MHTKMYTSKGQICTLVHATTKADEYIFAYAKTSAVKLRNKGPAPNISWGYRRTPGLL